MPVEDAPDCPAPLEARPKTLEREPTERLVDGVMLLGTMLLDATAKLVINPLKNEFPNDFLADLREDGQIAKHGN